MDCNVLRGIMPITEMENKCLRDMAYLEKKTHSPAIISNSIRDEA